MTGCKKLLVVAIEHKKLFPLFLTAKDTTTLLSDVPVDYWKRSHGMSANA